MKKLPGLPFGRMQQERALPSLPEGPNEIMILYSLHRSELAKQLELSRKNWKKHIVYSLLFFVVWMTLAKYVFNFLGSNTSMVMLWALYVIPLFYLFRRLGPTAIQLGKQGVRFHWVHFIGAYSSPWIPWRDVKYVSSAEYKRRSYLRSWPSQSLDFAIDVGSCEPDARRFLSFLKLIMGAEGKDKHFLTIRLDRHSIIHEDDVASAVGTARTFLPKERVDESVKELLPRRTEAGFTELWLEEFKAPSGNLRISAGSLVANGKYRVLRTVGAGGHAITYEAERLEESQVHEGGHPESRRSEEGRESLESSGQSLEVVRPLAAGVRVALKEIVLPQAGGKEIRQRAIKNVAREAELLKRLDHDQIVKCHEIFVEGHKAYLCLDFVEGVSLRQMAENNPLSQTEVVGLARQMLAILDYLHRQAPPVMHRDFTPDNLILRKDGVLVLIDFNVAEQREGFETATIVGKHCFIPPEQFRGKPSSQSDIYAFGCCLYFLLTGMEPEPITQSHPKDKVNSVSDEMDALVARATALELSERFSGVAPIAEALDASTPARASE